MKPLDRPLTRLLINHFAGRQSRRKENLSFLFVSICPLSTLTKCPRCFQVFFLVELSDSCVCCCSTDGPDEVAITPANPPAVIKAGSNFSLSCSARSSPPATFTWYHNQAVMKVDGPLLTLEKIQQLGLGEKAEDYTCRAKNAKTQRDVSSPAAKFSVMGE